MNERRMERRLAAIVAADIAGYSRLMGAAEEETLQTMKAHRGALIDPTIAEHGGTIIKTTGDGMLIEFPSVVEAVRCCLAVQKGMQSRNASVAPERRIEYRIGVNIGDVIIDDGDIFGDGVNIAARLENESDPGGICISQSVVDQVKKKIDLRLDDLGARTLKNIEEPIRVFRILDAKILASSETPNEKAGDAQQALRPVRPSLAILPFHNMGGDAEADFIADGIGLSIQTLLVQLSGLFFINACSHQAYREGIVDAVQVAAELSVRYVLEGAVQRFGNRARVTVQLTDVHSSEVVWADTYDRDLEDIFALQDDITREVISSLSSEMLGGHFDRIWISHLSAPGAWQYYLSGISHFYKFTPNDNAIARQEFHKLHDLHPDQTIGASNIALTHWTDAGRGFVDSPAESIEKAREWAEKSIEPEDHNIGLSHAVLGSIRVLEHRHDEGLALCLRSVAFRANCPFAIGQLAFAQLYSGNPSEAVRSSREALSLRLHYPPPLVNTLAKAYRDNNEIDLSIPAAEEAVRLSPKSSEGMVTLCSDYQLSGKQEEARAASRRIIEIDPEFRVSSFAERQPYRDDAWLAKVAGALEAAGLPS